MINRPLSPLLGVLELAILPGRPSFGFSHTELYGDAYRFWMSYQKSMRQEVELPTEAINSDDFLRHDFVNVLTYEQSVVAMINCTLLDLSSEAEANHSYINAYFGDQFVSAALGSGLRCMATLENIVSHPEWRSAKVGLSLGAVVMSVALKKVFEVGCDGAFGAARTDAPTARISYDFGASAIVTGLTFHGKPTDLLVFPANDIRPHPSKDVEQLATRLWATRLDATATKIAAGSAPTRRDKV